MEEKFSDQKFILDRHSSKLHNILKEANSILDIYYKKKIIKKKFPIFSEELNNIKYLLLSFSFVISLYNRIKYSALSVLIGNSISYYIFKNNKKFNKEFNCYNYNEFRKEYNIDDTFLLKLGDFFLSILSSDPINLFEREYIIEDSQNEYYMLKINTIYLEEIKEKIILHPSTLPMVCKPNEWNENSFGGYLDNKIKGDDIISGSSMHKHNMENKKPLYDATNYLNSIKFSINNLLLDFLNNEGNYLLKEIEADDELQRTITLKIANTFINVPYYLSARAD